MSNVKRKPSPTAVSASPSSLQPRTSGFHDRDQRLPPSPPLSDPCNSLMGIVRSRYRHAVKRLFGTVPIILNSPCNMYPHATPSKPNIPVKHEITVQEDLESNDTTDNFQSPTHYRKRKFVSQQCDESSPSASTSVEDVPLPTVKRRRPTVSDQVVPSRPDSRCKLPSCGRNGCVCANSLWTSRGIGPDVMLRTAEELSDRVIVLYGRAVNISTNEVDYSSLHNSPDFHQYLVSAKKLRYFDPLLLSHTERKAFFLNVYNSLMIHAITVMSKPRTMFERISMYNTAAYNIGGRHYTLNMIEHGILRSNRCGNGPFAQPQFDKSDARLQCTLPHVDPRIHFALNCGARSCPRVRFYEASSLDKSLDSATRAYLQDITVDMDTRTITIPKLLQWYKADFCKDGDLDALLKWTLPYLESSTRKSIEQLFSDRTEKSIPFKVSFGSYDWTVNDSSGSHRS